MRYFRFSETSRPTAFEEICCRHLQGTPKTEAGRSFQLLAHIKLSHFPEENNYPVYSPNVEAGGMYSYHEVTLIVTAIVRHSSCEVQSLWVLDNAGTPSVEHLFHSLSHTHTHARARTHARTHGCV